MKLLKRPLDEGPFLFYGWRMVSIKLGCLTLECCLLRFPDFEFTYD